MAKKVERIIIDTNLWISFLITRDLKRFDEKIKKNRIKILFSLELMEEFIAVAERPKFKKYFDKKDIEQLIELFDVYGEIIDVKSSMKICRDPKDNFLLALAKDGKADVLITGDKDLLELKMVGKTRVVKITDHI